VVTQRDFSEFEFRVLRTERLDSRDLEAVMRLFNAAYRQANPAYIEKSLSRLAYLAIARREGEPAGFALGEMRIMDLPRLPSQVVSLAGICCIDLPFRRRGLFGVLEGMALGAAKVTSPSERRLSCGRMAHPASFKGMSRSPSVVPRRGVRPTPWQREVGQEGQDGEGQDEDCQTLHDASHAVCLLCRSARSVGTNQRTRAVGHDRNPKQSGCQREGGTPTTRATPGPLG